MDQCRPTHVLSPTLNDSELRSSSLSLTHSMTYVVYKWANSLLPTLNKIMIHFCKAPNNLFIFKISTISLRANFQKTYTFFSLLDPKSGKGLICVAYMTGKYPWSIIRVVV